ncbi:hypothetical protein [Micromonospora psammae]|uniref:hypothetical protein n=1 Tax=Micromonospora sp. CPCC 205556 TaxID=3122398 RepID=UPI002FF09302
MTRNQALLDFVFDRLADTNTSDRLAEVILGACASDDHLRAVLTSEDAHRPGRNDSADAQAHVYLDRIPRHRPEGELHLRPANGLTLVVGRNGSDKLSF